MVNLFYDLFRDRIKACCDRWSWDSCLGFKSNTL